MEQINNGLGENRNGGYDRIERWDEETVSAMTKHFSEILNLIGEDGKREGLKETTVRVAKSMLFLTKGYGTDPADILKSAVFHEEYSEMVIVKEIELFSMCEHHILPFIGRLNVPRSMLAWDVVVINSYLFINIIMLFCGSPSAKNV